MLKEIDMLCWIRLGRGATHRRPVLWPAGLAFLAGVLLVAPAWGQQPGTQAYTWGCVDESNGLSNVCTANDLTFVQLGLGIQRDGCVNPSDRVKIYLRGALQNTTAQARYDVGIFFPGDDGGIIDPEGDGALTGVCSVAGLMNPETTPPTDACVYDPVSPGNLDLFGGGGPWVNAESAGANDRCGDIYANASSTACDRDPADGSWDDTIVWIDLPADGIEIMCNDDDGAGVSDGFVDLPVCLTWGNQQDKVDANGDGLCDFNATLKELRPGTKSKCRCSMNEPTDIPAPDLGLSCSLPLGVSDVQPGGFVQVSITYTNSCACLPDTGTEERFRCCTASYVQFPIEYDDTYGTVSGISAGTGTAVDDGAGTITWTPASGASTSGVIAQGESSILTFYYHVDPSAPDPSSTIVSVGTTWSNASTVDGNGVFTVDPRDQTALTSQCTFDFDSTWATISNLTADVRDARTVVSWESSAEAGSLGYDVYRSATPGDPWVKVNEALLPAIGDGPGGRYQFVDDSAPIEGSLTYKVVEIDAWGSGREAGPVTVELKADEGTGPERDFMTERRRPSERLTGAIGKPKRQQTAQPPHTLKSRRLSADARRQPSHRPYLKIGVAESGMYRVPSFDVAGGLGATEAEIYDWVTTGRLSLTTGGQPVAWRPDPANRGILFYGQAPDNLYDAERVYVMRAGTALLIGEASGEAPEPANDLGSFRGQSRHEENLLLRPFNVIEDNRDFWFWTAVLAGDPNFGQQHVEFEVDDVAESDDAARLTVSFSGFGPVVFAEGSVMLNGHHIGNLWGPTFSAEQTVLEFDHSYLQDGLNRLDFIGVEGGFLVDGIEVSYERLLRAIGNELSVLNPRTREVTIHGFSDSRIGVYDVTDPLRPVVLPSATASAIDGSVMVGFSPTAEDGTYLAAALNAIRRPSRIVGRSTAEFGRHIRGADYVIITTRDFMNTAKRLADHRRGQGLETMVVDIEDIFDEFAFGSRDPNAIRAFLAQAVEHWMKPPSYVLLAGRGHYDYRDYLGYGGNLLPPALAATSRGLVPSDNRIADIDGDGLPDLAIGRLPVLSAAELSAAIDKIVAYESAETGPWSGKLVLSADNPDDAGDFIASSDRIAAAAPAGREIEKVYLSQPHTADEVHSRLVAALEEGVGIVNWVGHAGFDSFAHERVLTSADLPELAATEHPAVVLGLTCLINNFGLPFFTAFGEELALVPGGGAIGVWAAGGLSNNAVAERLGEHFMAALEGDGQRLGDIIQRAFDEFHGEGSSPQSVGEYVFFGDPTLVLK